MDFIARPFGWLLLNLYNLTGSYGIAIFLFALLVRLILLLFFYEEQEEHDAPGKVHTLSQGT